MLLKGGPKPARAAPQGPRHLVWVWQFSTDGQPNIIGARLRDNNLGIVLKTHDGLQWMSEYDKSPFAVSGPAQISVLANYYEAAGVPFHAWAVLHGTEPQKEAKMAADVLAAGARSIFLDVEPHSGFWSGSPADAETFGRELRRLQPSGKVVLSVDPRPWIVNRLPMKEMLAFSDELAPQNYWLTFNTPANHQKYAESGFPVPPEGITPEFLLSVDDALFANAGLPIVQVGQGATTQPDEWRRFIDRFYSAGGEYVTVWRYGVTTQPIFDLLRDTPARQPVSLVEGVPAQSGGVHVVQAGETLGAIAATYGVSINSLVEANGLADANYLYVGQELKIPGEFRTATVTSETSTAVSTFSTRAASRSYTVQSGDTLYGIAGRFGTSVDGIVAANGLANPDILAVGQVLAIP